MRYLVIAVTSIVVFFPLYWLFNSVVGPNWGAGIAAFAMYIAFPVFAMKLWPSKSTPTDNTSMSQALESGLLKTDDYRIVEAVEIGELTEETLHYLVGLDNGTSLLLSGYSLSSIVDRGEFPCSKIRVFTHATDGITYGIEKKGERLASAQKLAITNFDALYDYTKFSETVVLDQPLDKVIGLLKERI